MENKYLKDCPFCQSDTIEIGDAELDGSSGYYVYCSHCNARGPRFKNVKEVIRKWDNCLRYDDITEAQDEAII